MSMTKSELAELHAPVDHRATVILEAERTNAVRNVDTSIEAAFARLNRAIAAIVTRRR